MSLGSKPLASLEETDFQALVDNQVSESKTIEYKESLPGNSDSDKREFLADMSSFANAAGGHLIYGIKEDHGLPIEIPGLQITDADAEKLRLENMIRDGIEPRIPGVSIKAVFLASSNVTLAIHVPRSWASPHRVKFGGHGHFYSRNSAGKYRLDVSELRAAFGLSETAAERIRAFRAERLCAVISGELPAPMDDGAKVVLHIIPISTSDPSIRFDVSSLAGGASEVEPLRIMGGSNRYNLDGFLTFAPNAAHGSYVQIFRDGTIEAVDRNMLRERDDKKYIPSTAFERELTKWLAGFLAVQKQLGVEPPLFVMLSLLGVSGYTMGLSRERFDIDEEYPIDRDDLILPEFMVETFDINAAQVLRPTFDAVWNAAGWPRSINYNDEGQWVGH